MLSKLSFGMFPSATYFSMNSFSSKEFLHFLTSLLFSNNITFLPCVNQKQTIFAEKQYCNDLSTRLDGVYINIAYKHAPVFLGNLRTSSEAATEEQHGGLE